MTTHSPRRSLTERLARDVDAAFPALVERHIDGIYSGVRGMTPSHADAEDLTQETFLRAYRALTGYDADRIRQLRVRPWRWTIAVNLCRSAARRRSRRVTEVGLAAHESTAAAGNETEGEALAAAMTDTWQRRLGALSETQRTAIVLRHVADLPYDEIATITQRPVGTVKADVHRGLQRLRAALVAEAERQETGS